MQFLKNNRPPAAKPERRLAAGLKSFNPPHRPFPRSPRNCRCKLLAINSVKPSPTQSNHAFGVATACRHKISPCETPQPQQRLPHRPICHSSFVISPSVPSAPRWQNQPQSNPVKPCAWSGNSLSPQPIPRCSPSRPAANGYGPRLWQSPAAALRPARHPNLNEILRPPISSFVIRHSSFPQRPLMPKIPVHPWLKESSLNRFSHFYCHFCYSASRTDAVPLGLNYP